MIRGLIGFTGWLAIAVGITLALVPLAAWMDQPSMTEMQVFLAYWPIYAGATVALLLGLALAWFGDQ